MKIKIHNSNLILIYLSIVLISFIFGFIVNEDSLGGAYHDYKFHEKYFFRELKCHIYSRFRLRRESLKKKVGILCKSIKQNKKQFFC